MTTSNAPKMSSHRFPINRRQFLQTTTLAAAAMPFAAASADAPAPGKTTIKVGCLSWCFHDFSPGVDPEAAINIIGELGFDGIEMIVTASRDLKDFWTNDRVDRYKQQLEKNK